MERYRGQRGQATSEYVALVALVAVALTVAAGLTSGGVGSQVLAGIQRGLCRVTVTTCPRPEPPQPDLAPCPLERGVQEEELGTTIAVMHLGTSGTLSAVRRSDGRVTVTLAHGNEVGGEAGVGARVRVGGTSLGLAATAEAGATWTSGRAWTFASEPQARSFIDRYGRKATIQGQLLDGVRSRCSVLCDAIGWRPHAELPEPDEIFAEAGPSAALVASFGARTRLGLDGDLMLGRRVRRDGATTWYLKLDGSVAAKLDLQEGTLMARSGSQGVLAYELDARGRPRALRISLGGELRAEADVTWAGAVRAGLTRAHGARVELDATLDLRDPANRAAARATLDGLSDPRMLPGYLKTLAGRLAHNGQIDRRVYVVDRASGGVGASLGLGAKLGGSLDHVTSSMRLVRAETRLPGLPFLPRDDCRAS
jgi:hypothetical protein